MARERRLVGVTALCIAATAAQGQPVLTLVPDAACYSVNDTITVDVVLSSAPAPIVGGQFFLSFDPALGFVGIEPGDAAGTDPTNPFEREIFEQVSGGDIDYAVGVPNNVPGATSGVMAVITFTAVADVCDTAGLVSFRANSPPTKLVDENDVAYVAYVAGVNLIVLDLSPITIDSANPTITCPANLAVQCAAAVPPPDFAGGSASDNCSPNPAITHEGDVDNGGTGCPANPRIITRTYRATDACGRFTECTQTITVADTTAPTITCPVDVTVDCTANVPAPSPGSITASDNCDPNPSVTHQGDVDNGGAGCPADPLIITRTYRATDACGNFAECVQTITVIDMTSPTITCPADITVECPAAVPPADFAGGVAADNCDPNPSVTHLGDTDNGGAGCPGNALVITRTYRVTDACGNLAECAQSITVVDTTDPVITCPPDVTVNADAGGCTASAATANTGTSTATDNCDPNPAITAVRSDGLLLSDAYPAGTTTITWTATDTCGNSDACPQTVTVNPINELIVDVQLSPTVEPGPLTRCITFELFECGPNSSVVVEQEVIFTGGLATGVSVLVPCGNYTCITARDWLHTLRRTDDDDFGVAPIAGTQYIADFTDKSASGGDDDSLIGGNLNDDDSIDIIDFGMYANRFGTSPGANTNCAAPAVHADISGNGQVGTEDFTFIQINFLRQRDPNCCGLPGVAGGGGLPAGPIVRISVGELWRHGLGHLAVADLNGDGFLDQYDIAAFMLGERPVRPKRKPYKYTAPRR